MKRGPSVSVSSRHERLPRTGPKHATADRGIQAGQAQLRPADCAGRQTIWIHGMARDTRTGSLVLFGRLPATARGPGRRHAVAKEACDTGHEDEVERADLRRRSQRMPA